MNGTSREAARAQASGAKAPVQRYRTIVADPPWPIKAMRNDLLKAGRHYPTMSVGEIAALPVADMAASTAHLYCWAVLPLMAEAYDVVRGWGFRPRTVVTWCKPGPGLGGGYRGNTEHLIVATCGLDRYINPTCATCGGRARGARKCGCERPAWRHKGLPCEWSDMEQPFDAVGAGTWYEAPRGAHSAKPELFLDLIEQMSPGPYLELFARRARFGWSYWGDESLGTASMPGAAA